MRILSLGVYNVNNYNVNNYHSQLRSGNVSAPLKRDTVSFKHYVSSVPKDLQVYRSISEKEYKKLISGKTIECAGYLTSSEKGWNASNWQNGYVFPGTSDKNAYFVTFKVDSIPIKDRRDYEGDTRYGISNRHCHYDISHVANIRKGVNVHGELVYSPNFEKDKLEDVRAKNKRIKEIRNELANTKDEKEKSILWDELTSFSAEFPRIVIKFKPYVDFSSPADVNGFAELISMADKKEFLPLYRKCIDSYISNEILPTKIALQYYTRFAEKQDISRIFELLDSVLQNGYLSSAMLNKCTKAEDFYMIKNMLLKENIKYLHTLALYCSLKDKKGEQTDVLREILYILRDKGSELNDGSSIYPSTIETCAKMLSKFGNKRDVRLLSKFYESANPGGYPSAEVREAIQAIYSSNKNN